jgi:hypothetical protein
MHYLIEARSYRLGIWSHNFWVLRDETLKCALAELHGLAMSRVTGRIVPIGTTAEHGLRAYVFAHEEAYAAGLGLKVKVTRMFGESPAHPVYEGADGLERWQAAVAAIPVMNELDLDYPPWGFNFFGATVNSNSAYRTFAELMGIEVYEFPDVVGPGMRNRMLTLEEIERLRFQPQGPTAAEAVRRA